MRSKFSTLGAGAGGRIGGVFPGGTAAGTETPRWRVATALILCLRPLLMAAWFHVGVRKNSCGWAKGPPGRRQKPHPWFTFRPPPGQASQSRFHRSVDEAAFYFKSFSAGLRLSRAVTRQVSGKGTA